MGQYNINTPKFRVSFCSIIEGKENDSGKIKYGCTALFPIGESLKDIKAMATQIMTDKFGTDKAKWPKKFHKPWHESDDRDETNEDRDPDTKAYAGYLKGALHMNIMGADDAPEVVDNLLKPIIEKRKVYSGCYGIANIDLFWFEAKNKAGVVTNKGISCSMNCFQKLEDGEPLGGASRPQASSVFAPVAVNSKKGATAVFDEDDEDPMA